MPPTNVPASPVTMGVLGTSPVTARAGLFPPAVAPPTYPDHGSAIQAPSKQPLTLNVATASILSMSAAPVTVGSVGASAITAIHGVYPDICPGQPFTLVCSEGLACSELLVCTDGGIGSFPGHGSDLAALQPSTRTLAVVPV